MTDKPSQNDASTGVSAAQRVKEVHERVMSGDPRVAHVFTQLFDSAPTGTLKPAPTSDTTHELSDALVSVKDLFDVAGYVTRAGTRFMAQNAPATQDAAVVSRLRDCGALMVGHTGMTELAYSGLGINPHYGTADNALYPGCIPGGSTAGGAVSVATGLVDIALGTDTGGSLRIPAAFNGIVGYKPTQGTVSRAGCKALSVTLDSVGMMATTTAICQQVYRVIRSPSVLADRPLTPTFVVPTNYGMDDLEPVVEQHFRQAVEALERAGFEVQQQPLSSFETLKTLPVWQFAAVECRAEYEDAYVSQRDLLDPAVRSRMQRADEVSAVDYRHTLNTRDRLVRDFNLELDHRVLLMPTVPILPPRFSALLDTDEYTRVNLQVLRNTSIANVMDGCSISLPITLGGHTTGVMLTAQGYSDDALLGLAAQCREAFDVD